MQIAAAQLLADLGHARFDALLLSAQALEHVLGRAELEPGRVQGGGEFVLLLGRQGSFFHQGCDARVVPFQAADIRLGRLDLEFLGVRSRLQ